MDAGRTIFSYNFLGQILRYYLHYLNNKIADYNSILSKLLIKVEITTLFLLLFLTDQPDSGVIRNINLVVNVT